MGAGTHQARPAAAAAVVAVHSAIATTAPTTFAAPAAASAVAGAGGLKLVEALSVTWDPELSGSTYHSTAVCASVGQKAHGHHALPRCSAWCKHKKAPEPTHAPFHMLAPMPTAAAAATNDADLMALTLTWH